MRLFTKIIFVCWSEKCVFKYKTPINYSADNHNFRFLCGYETWSFLVSEHILRALQSGLQREDIWTLERGNSTICSLLVILLG